jgi:hypothetical protein
MWPRNGSQQDLPRIRFRPVRNTQETANHILVDRDAESQHDLLSDAGDSPSGDYAVTWQTTASLRALYGDDHTNEQDEEVAHPGNGISPSTTTAFRPILQFAMDTLADAMPSAYFPDPRLTGYMCASIGDAASHPKPWPA